MSFGWLRVGIANYSSTEKKGEADLTRLRLYFWLERVRAPFGSPGSTQKRPFFSAGGRICQCFVAEKLNFRFPSIELPRELGKWAMLTVLIRLRAGLSNQHPPWPSRPPFPKCRGQKVYTKIITPTFTPSWGYYPFSEFNNHDGSLTSNSFSTWFL